MSESFVNPLFGRHAAPVTEGAGQPEVASDGTGQPEVDAVLTSLAALDDLPVDEHVAVFERAHESLRRTLSGAGQTPPAALRS